MRLKFIFLALMLLILAGCATDSPQQPAWMYETGGVYDPGDPRFNPYANPYSNQKW